ncbi:hypothetical protein BDV38DRAFT_276779 [Aspergillus pseudotamarii]|uniref:Uncharacterized protein n=1 Tax=Aspergillus pseudotamarii TaxID=132259 RepID=A0A5N6TBP8_ASPPS|nr:uncharacterized protein BDV38DRAFT_276779 [Aspergillus pseudotamarii]KAE8143697.1 hypothetical protein BDV38DRAFT_276779 [Aspergillus pseudotamarii]
MPEQQNRAPDEIVDRMPVAIGWMPGRLLQEKMLPDDLYSKLNHVDTDGIPSEKAPLGSGPPKSSLKDRECSLPKGFSMIPYLASFVRLERNRRLLGSELEFTQRDIPRFNIALQKLGSGNRFYFRSQLVDIARYLTLCETYDSLARDAAFPLMFPVLGDKFGDEAGDSVTVHNVVLFIVSHPGTFKHRTRAVFYTAYEERFVVSHKELDWINSTKVSMATVHRIKTLWGRTTTMASDDAKAIGE